ncbi:glycosyltransferase [Marinobacter gelidimuriae]|uniref:glycosyltransferase n=1 Tax=Marinobacter gelidimuriae TaxID=2739064 RepID=UPI00035DCB85|nr:glycosyltransferase [Marinobacter gelidimuriae]
MAISPVVLFVYNRPQHTRQTVEALLKNDLADQSDLIVFSDAAKNSDAARHVQEVRDYLKTTTGFKSVRIVEREENLGLAKSIIHGVTEVVNQYGKVIVLEDDIVASPSFLTFMNEALDFFQENKKVWHIGGWIYPIDTSGLNDTFLWRVMNCWGWATWSDRWAHFEKDTDKLLSEFSSQDIHRFNLDNADDFWSQVKMNKSGRINTWAIYWYATIFRNDGLCLGPMESLVQNVGFDGSGMHCGNSNTMQVSISTKSMHEMPSVMAEDVEAVNRIRQFLLKSRPGFARRLAGKIKRLMTP